MGVSFIVIKYMHWSIQLSIPYYLSFFLDFILFFRTQIIHISRKNIREILFGFAHYINQSIVNLLFWSIIHIVFIESNIVNHIFRFPII